MSQIAAPPGCVALTGATGFVGGHILRQLTAAGWQVRALTRRSDGLGSPGPGVTPVVGGLESEAALAELVKGADAVVHCAGLVAARRLRDFDQVNHRGTARLAEIASSAPVPPRFLLISTLAARAPQVSRYAASKHLGEEALRQRGDALFWQILRPPVVYGPGDRATLGLFRQFSRGLAVIPRSRGRFSMIYAEDLAAGVAALLRGSAPGASILEIDDGRAGGYGWADVTAAAENRLGHRVRSIAVPGTVQRLAAAASVGAALLTGRAPMLSQGKVSEIAYPDWVCRTNRLNDFAFWQPAVGFEEGLSKTLAWYKAAGWL
ncbi:NAD-dependent epimerase/dehydratase family protein [Pelagibius sp.]|uniref:NAD-dependent epimerase/dehydratase family protein n=1 Tax=Pelagibius sp. TaxID=1931238 RepID=UPI003B50D86D